MNKILIILVTVCLLAISCRKASDAPVPAENPKLRSMNGESDPLETKFVVNGQDTVTLKLVMEPVITCSSYKTGETPKPCNILIQFSCTLSEPVNGYVKVDVQKNNIVESGDRLTEGSETGNGLAFSIAPNTTRFVYTSSFQNNNTLEVAENAFRIENVTFYKKVD